MQSLHPRAGSAKCKERCTDENPEQCGGAGETRQKPVEVKMRRQSDERQADAAQNVAVSEDVGVSVGE